MTLLMPRRCSKNGAVEPTGDQRQRAGLANSRSPPVKGEPEGVTARERAALPGGCPPNAFNPLNAVMGRNGH